MSDVLQLMGLALRARGLVAGEEVVADAVSTHRARLLLVAEDFLDRAQAGDFCFVEDRSPAPWLDRLEGLVLYRWNRRYPADAWLDVRPGPPGWTLARREEFSGHSHERITKEVYTR